MSALEAREESTLFDRIRRLDEGGREFWSARELSEVLGYGAWRNFSPSLERAAKSAEVQGHDVPRHFAQSRKVSTSGPDALDYHLTRFAAYLVAMNADPNKQAVADAQAYFAVQTRVAEVAAAPTGPELLALAVIEAQQMLAAKDEQIKELAPKAAQADTFRQSEGLRTIGDLANDLKVHVAANMPGRKVRQQDVFDQAGRLGLIIRANSVRNNQPTARAIDAGWVKPYAHTYESNSHGPVTKVSTRLTPRGYGRLWDGCLQWLGEHEQLAVAA